jgi:hypothetical protein
MSKYKIAQINIARMKGVDLFDPVMREFVENLDIVNALAENSDGFVWRLKDESNNATNLNPYEDEQILINISVWESIETLEQFVYKTFHTAFLKRRKEWFQSFGKTYSAMWWIPEGELPTVAQAVGKLDLLQQNGASGQAFDFKKKYPAPDAALADQFENP